MRSWARAVPVLFAGVALLAAACTPATGGGGGGGGPSNVNPVAVAAGAPLTGNVPLVVNFDASGSSDSDGTIVSYSWDFGNSTNGSGVAPSATYNSAGVFNVVLTVTDDDGGTDTDSITVNVQGDGDGDGYFPPADCNDGDSGINPGAADPAGDDIDQNCDGIDGEENNAIFVNSGTGSDTSTCGTIGAPCATIGQGQTRAGAASKTKVYVAGGTYAKFTVVAGLEVRGGFGQNWQRGLTATSPTVANINASFDASVGGPVGIIATGISTPTTVADLKVTGATAGPGQTSYGVHVSNSTSALVLDSLDIVGGTGGVGANGNNGSGGWGGPATSGNAGIGGFEPGGVCNNSDAGAGGAGAGGGGTGGKGGEIDTSCGLFSLNLDAQAGSNGGNGSGAGGGFGTGGAGGVGATEGFPWVCTISGGNPVHGSNGSPGASGSAGSPGAGGPAGGAGGTGGLGSNGLPGGGGGGGGANDCNIDDAGAGGGGGGAGGARATSAGTGGGPGAPAIGLRLQNASPTLIAVQITLGVGGKGGNGGAGAAGQPGGAGGPGGPAYDRGGAGGAGGAGGTGGASGAGGGGGGGSAIGMSRTASSAPVGSPSFNGGAGGAGGSGGNPGSQGLVQNLVVA